jgi:hypothetical protein
MEIGKQPKFAPPSISCSDLNKISDAVYGSVTVDGADVTRGPNGLHIAIPKRQAEVQVWVYEYTGGSGSGSGSASGPVGHGSSTKCSSGNRRYRWIEITPARCGTWTIPENAMEGDGEEHPAYEWNNTKVRDGTVQLIKPYYFWVTENSERVLVTEWRFHAAIGTAASDSGSGSGSGSGGGSPCQRLTVCVTGDDSMTTTMQVCLSVGGVPIDITDADTGEPV